MPPEEKPGRPRFGTALICQSPPLYLLLSTSYDSTLAAQASCLCLLGPGALALTGAWKADHRAHRPFA